MKYLAISDDDLLFQFMRRVASIPEEVLFLVSDPAAARKIRRQGGMSRRSALDNAAVYRRGHLDHVNQVMLFIRETKLQNRVYDLLRSLKRELPILMFSSASTVLGERKDPFLRVVLLDDIFQQSCGPYLLDTLNREKVERVRSLFWEKDKIHILLQHDPDPDAIGSALALRELLGRNRATTPIVTFGEVTRPENLAMIRLLDIQVERITPADLHREGARLALVDVQPPYFEQSLGKIDLVVDHHPKRAPYSARFSDLRAQYGATATIFTEYLRAAGMEPSQRLATALLYGIKSDTLFLERGSQLADLEAFTYLYPLANRTTISRMERPALPREDLEALGRGLSRLKLDNGIAVIHVGEVKREDVVPQMAEFCLQVEGVEWGVASGLCGDRVVISVRNVGYVKSAGEILKQIFDKLGSAGGHRSMAKAVVPLDRFREHFGEVSEKVIREAMSDLIKQRG
jgi:nanoRNase/pAp phosphatase (c-di-AMP/oligoRNAs hydrolase)